MCRDLGVGCENSNNDSCKLKDSKDSLWPVLYWILLDKELF